MATEEDLRRAALALPEVYEKASYGGAASYRTKPRAFAFVQDNGIVALSVSSEEEKLALLASDPDVFSTTPHYDGYAMVLVTLDAVSRDELAELVTEAWRLRAPQGVVRRWEAEHDTD